MSMHRTNLSSIADIYALAATPARLSEVRIDVHRLKELGVLRHAFKYSLWALETGGILEVVDEPSYHAGLSSRRVDFWQVRNELFKCIGADLQVDRIDPVGCIQARKHSETYGCDGLTIGIVFGGAESEVALLQNQIASIAGQVSTLDKPVEILVCGPASFDTKRLEQASGATPIRYINYSRADACNRAFIGHKKNILLDQASFNAVALSHARIVFTKGSLSRIQKKKFDAFTPAVFYLDGDIARRYLDYALIGSYDTARRSPRLVLASSDLPQDILYYLRHRVGFLDGGLIVLNKSKVRAGVYSNELSWGEGEDVDLCAKLYDDGCLIDLDMNIVCHSQSNKLQFDDSPWTSWRRRIVHALIRRGWK